MKSSIILISNPVAKRASERKIEKAYRLLKSRGYEVEIVSTKYKGHAEVLATQAIKKSPSLIVAAGGDGTFNEVINGIAGSEIPMAILPIGTTNVLAKELNIPENVKGAIEIAVSGTPRKISLGRIMITNHSSLITRYFILMAGIGFDGKAVFGINETIKKFSGKGSYICSGIKTLFRFHPDELTLLINGKSYSGYSAVIGNAAKYGGHFKIAPDARLTEPVLYVCLFKGKKRLDILRYFLGVLKGSHLKFSDVEYLKAERIEINGDAYIQLDGDYFGMTPAKVEIIPDMARLVY
jgi:diacylglycerol kinase (ATP)